MSAERIWHKIFFELRIFSRKVLRNFPSNCWAFISWVGKSLAKFPPNSCKNKNSLPLKKGMHRRASAEAQGEVIPITDAESGREKNDVFHCRIRSAGMLAGNLSLHDYRYRVSFEYQLISQKRLFVQKSRDFLSLANSENLPGKEGNNAQKSKRFLAKRKKQGIPKKARKGRSGLFHWEKRNASKMHQKCVRNSSKMRGAHFSVELKVRLEGYGYNLFCSHSSRCLAALVWQYFEEAFCAPKVRLKWYSFKGFPLIALIARGGGGAWGAGRLSAGNLGGG